MPDKQCENGHFIDESWDLCPYCPAVVVKNPSVAVPRPGKTRATSIDVPVPERAPAVQHRVIPASAPRTSAMPKVGAAVASRRYVVGWLVGLNQSVRGESFPVRVGRNVMGRDRRSDLHIPDDLASSHHADLVFRPEERRYILMDANSTNGTFVNELEIQPRRDLAPNDIIRIGTHRFLFVPLCREGFYWEDEGVLR
jgi:hypothetical protein